MIDRLSPTRLRSASLALGLSLLVALGSAGCRVSSEHREHRQTSRVNLDFAPGTKLVIENSRGTFRLLEGEAGKVQIVATKKVRARELADAEDIAKRIQVDVVPDGDQLRIVVDYPSDLKRYRERTFVMGFDVSKPSGGVDLEITLPVGTPVAVATLSGDLSIDRFAGSLRFESSNGDLRMEEFFGDVFVSSKSGDVHISQLDGALDMETSSGDLSLRNGSGNVSFDATSGDFDAERIGGDVKATTASGDVYIGEALGRIEIRTTSGDIDLDRIGGWLDATTASGDVTTSMVQPLANAMIQTSGGDVLLHLAEPLRGRLRVNTSSGEIIAKLPMAVEAAGKGRLVAVLGPGQADLDVRTSSGDVQILGPGTD